jgi:disulfide bond formation protein DsbB
MIIKKNYFSIILVFSVLILVSVYSLEHFMNLPACKLCVYQRIPYFFLIVFSLISFVINKNVVLFFCSFLCFCSSFVISLFHSLVERGMVKFEIGCVSSNKDFTNIDDLRNFLEHVPITKCDEIIFSFLGFSLANLNLIISIFAIILSIYSIKFYEKTT